VIRICFHGVESAGKSTLAARLGLPWVPEFGRTYCETHGTDLTMEDLLAIAAGQDTAMRQAAEAKPAVLILDTDPLMTAAWARMLFGTVPPELMNYAKAEHYLLFAPDVAWVADGTRFFGGEGERARFAAICQDVLVEAKLPFETISGGWAERERQVRAHIANWEEAAGTC
jgi:NadR type nicotinamide-nucleotide adenylyltransferase